MKTTTKTTTANIELRDMESNLIKIVKRNVSMLRAFDYLRKHGEIIWKKNVPYSLVIALN